MADPPTEPAPGPGPQSAWHALDPDRVCQALKVDPQRGLSPAQAADRASAWGRNVIPERPGPSALVRLSRQFLNPLVAVLLLAAVVAAVVAFLETEPSGGSPLLRFGDTAAILLIVLMNAGLGFFQEQRAERALAALRKMTAPTAVVLRERTSLELPAAELAVGDVVYLTAGAAVPSDLRLLESDDLSVDEAALTGESFPVEKEATAVVPADTPVADQRNMAFLGTLVTRGQAKGMVVRTGALTELGLIGAMIGRAPTSQTPLEQRIAALGRVILIVCLALSALLFAVGLLRGVASWSVLLLTAVSLAVAAIPEGLPAITTITLALGMHRMARRGAIIRRLPAVETLGSATVICTDKTGTVTENRMQVRYVATTRERLELDDAAFSRPPTEPLARVIETAFLSNVGMSGDPQGDLETGDPTEVALLTMARRFGFGHEAASAMGAVRRIIPFDSRRKFTARSVELEHAAPVWHIQGSPEVVIPRCIRAWGPEEIEAFGDSDRQRLLDQTNTFADDGLRVLALARSDEKPQLRGDRPDSEGNGELELPDKLTFLGLVAMRDPPRREAKEAVSLCRDAGIRVAMITGDHPRTAIAVAKEVELWESGSTVLTGDDIERMSDPDLKANIDQTAVFARVSPNQKLRVVEALRARGDVVAMTGDGVNDAPALKAAQIGVAMGKQGTEVARQAAEMVLADDNFATIVEAVREGRAIFSNIRKFVFFLNSSNAGLVFAVITASFFAALPQLTPLQLLWINLVTNGLPALALGVDPPDPQTMARRPQRSGRPIFGTRDAAGVLYVGTVMGASALFTLALPTIAPELFASRASASLEARTMAFTVLAFAPLFHAFNARSSTQSILSVGLFRNRALWLAVAISAALQLAAISVPALRPLFKTAALHDAQWLVVLTLAFAPVPAVEVAKWVDRRLALVRPGSIR